MNTVKDTTIIGQYHTITNPDGDLFKGFIRGITVSSIILEVHEQKYGNEWISLSTPETKYIHSATIVEEQ